MIYIPNDKRAKYLKQWQSCREIKIERVSGFTDDSGYVGSVAYHVQLDMGTPL